MDALWLVYIDFGNFLVVSVCYIGNSTWHIFLVGCNIIKLRLSIAIIAFSLQT